MPRGKHTRCAWCNRRGEYRYLEVMWRFGSNSPWNWCGGYACAGCRNAFLSELNSLGPAIVAWDG